MAKTKLVNFVLDQTGSMLSVKEETIVGFNEYVKTVKESDNEVLFTLTLFNSQEIEERNVATKIGEVEELTDDNYIPAHFTPLYDAIARTVNAVDTYIKENIENDDVSVLCVIMTDGQENDSREYTRAQIFGLIKQKENEGWTFVYMGANQDAYAEGSAMGMAMGNVMNYDPRDTRGTLSMAGVATTSYLASDAEQTKSFWKDAQKDKTKTTEWLKK